MGVTNGVVAKLTL